MTIAEKITEQTGVIGEKIEISNYALVEGEAVVVYNHPGYGLTSAVALNSASETALEAGKEIAMQVAANNPVALNKDGISKEVLDKEKEIGKEQAIQEGKPEELAEKISFGRVNKFIKENTLLTQPYFSDSKKSVEQYLDSMEKGLTIQKFERVSLG